MGFTTFIWTRLRLTSFLAPQNLVLRQQLTIMKRTNRRPKIKTTDRLFWVLLSRILSPWRKSLIFVNPQTVIKWHQNGFKQFWKLKSKPRNQRRPQVHSEIRDLIRKIASANPRWGAPRIHGELIQLGLDVSERTVSNFMSQRSPNPKRSQS